MPEIISTSPESAKPIPAVVLAGGKAKPELVQATGKTNRALVVVNGKPLLQHVTDSLKAAQSPDGPLGAITVVGEVPDSPDYARIPDQGDFVGNVFAGLTAYADAPYVLMTTSDLPFLSRASVTDFVCGAAEVAKKTGASIVWPVIPVAACYARFPGIRRTALRLKEGELTGGNLMLVRPHALMEQRQRIAEAYDARKKPLRLALMLGLGTLLRVVASQKMSPHLLTVSYLEAQASRVLGTPARALITDSVEIATDLDRPSDFAALGFTL